MGSIRDAAWKEAEERPTFTLDRRIGPFPKPSKKQQLRELAAALEVPAITRAVEQLVGALSGGTRRPDLARGRRSR